VSTRTADRLVRDLESICGERNVFWREEDTLVFEYDAGFDRRPPLAVAVPRNTDEIARCVRAARDTRTAPGRRRQNRAPRSKKCVIPSSRR